MTARKETSIYRAIKEALEPEGATVIRLENVSGAAVPDMMVFINKNIVLIEAKLQRGNGIQFSKFQVGLLHIGAEALPSWQYLVAVRNQNGIYIYRASSLIPGLYPIQTGVVANLSNIAILCPLKDLGKCIAAMQT